MPNKHQPKDPPDRDPADERNAQDPNGTGFFRWYQDLLDRILPKDKPQPPE